METGSVIVLGNAEVGKTALILQVSDCRPVKDLTNG
jgi:hypothetical protein